MEKEKESSAKKLEEIIKKDIPLFESESEFIDWLTQYVRIFERPLYMFAYERSSWRGHSLAYFKTLQNENQRTGWICRLLLILSELKRSQNSSITLVQQLQMFIDALQKIQQQKNELEPKGSQQDEEGEIKVTGEIEDGIKKEGTEIKPREIELTEIEGEFERQNQQQLIESSRQIYNQKRFDSFIEDIDRYESTNENNLSPVLTCLLIVLLAKFFQVESPVRHGTISLNKYEVNLNKIEEKVNEVIAENQVLEVNQPREKEKTSCLIRFFERLLLASGAASIVIFPIYHSTLPSDLDEKYKIIIEQGTNCILFIKNLQTYGNKQQFPVAIEQEKYVKKNKKILKPFQYQMNQFRTPDPLDNLIELENNSIDDDEETQLYIIHET